MKHLIIALTLLPFAFVTPAFGLTIKGCSTSDSAICLSLPDCHWDVNRRGCYEGAPEKTTDACAAHEDEGVCKSDSTLGCGWNAEKKICETKSP